MARKKSSGERQGEEMMRDLIGSLSKSERRELVKEIAAEFDVTARTAQRWITSAGQQRSLRSDVAGFVLGQLPSLTFTLEVSGEVCISDFDCREREFEVEFDVDEFAKFQDKLFGGDEQAAYAQILTAYGINPDAVGNKQYTINHASFDVTTNE